MTGTLWQAGRDIYSHQAHQYHFNNLPNAELAACMALLKNIGSYWILWTRRIWHDVALPTLP
jgi:hypothetical protein